MSYRVRRASVSANGLIIPVRTSAGHLASAFGTSFEQVKLRSGRTAYANTRAPQCDASVAGLIQGVVGLDTLTRPHALSIELPPVPAACTAAATRGIKVALFEFEPNSTSDIAAYQSCYGTSATVNYIEEDGGAGSGYGEGEAALDIEDVIGLAPKATVDVYQAPNSNTGPIDNYTAIVDNDTDQVISTSWGECESESGSSSVTVTAQDTTGPSGSTSFSWTVNSASACTAKQLLGNPGSEVR